MRRISDNVDCEVHISNEPIFSYVFRCEFCKQLSPFKPQPMIFFIRQMGNFPQRQRLSKVKVASISALVQLSNRICQRGMIIFSESRDNNWNDLASSPFTAGCGDVIG